MWKDVFKENRGTEGRGLNGLGLDLYADSDLSPGSEACPGVALRSLGGKWLIPADPGAKGQLISPMLLEFWGQPRAEVETVTSFIAVTKYRTRSYLRKEEYILVHGFSVQSICHGWKTSWRECEKSAYTVSLLRN